MLKHVDQHLIEILIVIVISVSLLASLQILHPGLAVLLVLILPQGRLVSRSGDLKKSGKSRWQYILFHEALIFIVFIMTALFLAR